MHRNVCALVLALAICGIVLPAGAEAAKPDTLALTPDAQTALVVIKTASWKPAPNMKSAFKLVLSAYDPAAQKIVGGPYSGSVLIEARERNFAEGYLLAPIKPGRWVVQSYSQQDLWALCFNAASLQFDVKPGEVVYLGDFDALAHRRQLIERTVRTGKTSLRGVAFADFFDLPDSPRFAPVDGGQLDAVREMLGRQAPLVTAPVRAVEFAPAQFGTGSTLFAERKCGGYFAVGAKAKSE